MRQQKMRASSISLKRGLGVPMYEREDKDTQDGIKTPAQPCQTPFVHSYFRTIETAKFRLNVVCVSAQNTEFAETGFLPRVS